MSHARVERTIGIGMRYTQQAIGIIYRIIEDHPFLF